MQSIAQASQSQTTSPKKLATTKTYTKTTTTPVKVAQTTPTPQPVHTPTPQPVHAPTPQTSRPIPQPNKPKPKEKLECWSEFRPEDPTEIHLSVGDIAEVYTEQGLWCKGKNLTTGECIKRCVANFRLIVCKKGKEGWFARNFCIVYVEKEEKKMLHVRLLSSEEAIRSKHEILEQNGNGNNKKYATPPQATGSAQYKSQNSPTYASNTARSVSPNSNYGSGSNR
jgi:hypothetical protein